MADKKKVRYADHEEHFRDHFRKNYKDGESHAYGDYESGYRTGFRHGTSSEHAGRSFGDLEPEMRRRHEKEHGEGSWRKVKGAARHAFERGRSHHGSPHTEGSTRSKSHSGDSLASSGSSQTASGGPGSAMREGGGFDAHREDYRRHHRETYGDEGDDFSTHEAAYRHGHRYGSAEEHRGRSYEDLEPEMRESYEQEHGRGAWSKVKGAVRHAFSRSRSS